MMIYKPPNSTQKTKTKKQHTELQKKDPKGAMANMLRYADDGSSTALLA